MNHASEIIGLIQSILMVLKIIFNWGASSEIISGTYQQLRESLVPVCMCVCVL